MLAATCFFLLLASAVCVPISRLGFKPEYLPEILRSNIKSKETTSYFTRQKLDHFAPEDSQVFSQRYFEVLDFFSPRDGPIFLVMCGELTCTGNYAETYVGTLAKSFRAAIITLEHRYYGRSCPFRHLTMKNFKYLSSKQSLFDHAVFIDYYQNLTNQRFNKTERNPWIVIGGSYSGALSAWFRVKFPHLVVGSWASSAVIEAILNYSAYDKQLGVSAGPKCMKALQDITKLSEHGLATNAAATKALFGFSAGEISDVDFLAFIADVAAGEIQYGRTDSLCHPLLKAQTAKRNLLKAYARFVNSTGDVGSVSNKMDDKSWTFQFCTELGFFQVAADRRESVRSSRINTQYYLNYCAEVLGERTVPDVKTTNLYYGGWNISGSRIMFLNGSQDPWRHASIQTSSKDLPALVLQCHTCSHCVDLSAPCPAALANSTICMELRKAHAFIHSNINEWLSRS